MACNCFGDLYKGEVQYYLKERGYDVKSVHALNLILEEMGILKHDGDSWLTTEAGMEYQLGKWPAFNAQEWHASLVDAVADYLDNN